CMIVSLEGLRNVFQLVPLSSQDLITLAFVALIPFVEFELIKRIAPDLLIPESELKFQKIS
ncbi:MAG: hypothetical protein QW104_02520, partial [Nitrososphaerota archaeon]